MNVAHDYQLSFIIGALAGVLLMPIVLILDIHAPYRIPITFFTTLFIMPLGLWFGNILQRMFGIGAQFSRYVVAGLLSFTIDFATLNIVSHITGITAGLTVGWINFPGFFLATVNAYFWNKLWVFQKNDESTLFADLPKFLFVIIIGIIINSTVLVAITSTIAPSFGLSERRWLNVGKIFATAVAVIWNFFGYKVIVFKE